MNLKRFVGIVVSFAAIVFAFQNCAKTSFTNISQSSLGDPSGDDTGNPGGGADPSGDDPGGKVTRTVSLPVSGSATNDKVKMLIVIDDSYSMGLSIEQLQNRIDDLVNQFKGRNVEVGLTTTNYDTNTGDWSYWLNGVQLPKDPGAVGGIDISKYMGQTLIRKIAFKAPALRGGSFVYTSGMTENQFSLVTIRLKAEVDKIKAYASSPAGHPNIELERGLCVISHYLADTNSSAFLKPQDKVGIVVITDEDDYSGLTKEKCRQSQEITVQGVYKRQYFAKLKPLLPGGPAWSLQYSYQKYYAAYTSEVVIDGRLVTVNHPARTETHVDNKYFLVTEAGHNIGDTCSATDLQRFLDAARQNLPAGVDPSTVQNRGCNIPYTGGFIGIGDEVRILEVEGALAERSDLCTQPFSMDGRTYSNLIEFYNNSPAHNYATNQQTTAGSLWPIDPATCRAGEKVADFSYGNTTTIIPIIPAASDFGPAIANLAKTRFNNSVFISSIIHTAAGVCPMDPSQSVGAQYLKLPTAMGTRAYSSSICSNNFSEPILKLTNQILIPQRQFSLALSATEKVVKVTIIKANGAQVAVASADFAYVNGILSVNSTALEAGGSILVGIGPK